jgi:hypothetical protein
MFVSLLNRRMKNMEEIMLKRMKVAAAATAALAISMTPTAMAQSNTFSPAGSFTATGIVQLSQTIVIDCTVTVSGTINSDGSATVTNVSFSPPSSLLCGTLVSPTGDWTLQAGPGTSSVTMNVGASTFTGGNCSGSIVASYSAGVISLSGTVPGSPSPCSVNGSVTVSPVLTIT